MDKKLVLIILAIGILGHGVIAKAVTPGQYGLSEGDVISATGDPDVYIVNSYGYKRLFVNPEIFSLYGHLGWDKIKKVTPEERDAFTTSGLFRDCETNDQKVYGLDVINEDVANLRWVNTTGTQAVKDDPNFFQKVFCINIKEEHLYGTGKTFNSVSEIPNYSRITIINNITINKYYNSPSPTPSASVSPTPSSTLTPTPTPSSTVTPTPTPNSTVSPTPTPTPSAHFLKYGFNAPEIVNWTTRPESWASNVAELKIDLTEKDTKEAIVSPVLTSVSLGKFVLHLPRDTYIVGDINISAAFWSDDLSNRNDQLYGINKNIFKRLYLKSDIYGEKTFPAVLTEPTDYYFKGNYYVNFFGAKLTNTAVPNTVASKINISGNRLVLLDTDIVFEIFLEFKCTNVQCLDPDGQNFNYLNNGHLQPKINVNYESYNYNQETNNYTSIKVQNVLLNSDGSLKELGINFPGRPLVFKTTTQ